MNIKFNMSEFKTLDPRKIYSWAIIPKTIVLIFMSIIILVLSSVAYFSDKYDELNQAELKEEKLKNDFLDKKRQAINLDLYKNQLVDIEKTFGTLLKQLPSKSQMDGLLHDINQVGLGRGLQFELFKPSEQEKINEFYAEKPISIRLTGNYVDIGFFASDVAQLARIVALSELNLVTKDGLITLEATARTFRYLDEEELAAVRAEKAKAKRAAMPKKEKEEKH